MQVPHNNTSAAYDLSLFDTAQRRERAQEEKKPELKMKTSSAAKVGKPMSVVLFAGLFLAVFIMFLYSKAQLSEINLEINSRTAALQDAQMLNEALHTELNGSVSLENVEEYAENQLGMQKVNAAQEEYVEMNIGSMTETSGSSDENVFVAISNWFNGILEYLGF